MLVTRNYVHFKIIKCILLLEFYLMAIRSQSATQLQGCNSQFLLPNQVMLYTEPNFKGSCATVIVTKCISPLKRVVGEQISSLKTKDHCINIYQGDNCTGNFIIIKPGTPAHNKLSRWNSKTWTTYRIKSIGPCDDECSSRHIHTPRLNTLMKVNLHSALYTVQDSTITLEVEGCTIISKSMRRKVSAARIKSGLCIELYENWNCSGQSIQLAQNIPQHLTENLDAWNFSKKAVAASPCGYNCNRRQSRLNEATRFNSPGENVLTIFKEPGYKGEKEDLTLMDGDCVNLTESWGSAGIIESILTYGRCVEIFETDLNCNSTNGNMLRLNNSESDILAYGWNNGIKSIGICPEEKYEKINVDNSISFSLIDLEQLWSYPLTYVLLSLFIVLIVIAISATYIIKLRKSNKRLAMIISQQEIYEFRKGTTVLGETECKENIHLLPQNQPYDQRFEISREYINFDQNSILGEGEFGIVYRGHTNPPTLAKECPVAVKAVKPFGDVEYVRAMLKEIKIMIYVGKHPNIVQLIGCHTENLAKAELFILTELCENGSLLTFLQKHENSFVNLLEDNSSFKLKPTDAQASSQTYEANLKTINGSHFSFIHLIQWSLQIAQGMEHLSDTRVIHGDLATRNVLLDEHFTAKISDFGLSKQLYVDVSYMKKSKVPLPWRGMAIETLRSLQFSIESDIWAFGITVWEIFTLGGLPYPGKVWDESFLDELANGLRPLKPKYATNELYCLMMSCWHENPDLRTPFSELTEKLEASLATHLANSSDEDFENTKDPNALSSLPNALRLQNSKIQARNNGTLRRPRSAVPKFLSSFMPK